MKDRLGKPGLSREPSQRPRYPVLVVAEGARAEDGKMISVRGIAPACELSLVDISVALGKIDLVNVDRDYDSYHLKNIGM